MGLLLFSSKVGVVVQCLDAVDMAGHRMIPTYQHICSSDDYNYSPAVASIFTRQSPVQRGNNLGSRSRMVNVIAIIKYYSGQHENRGPCSLVRSDQPRARG